LDHPTLKNKVLSGIYWNITESVGRNFFRVVVALILARLLEPSDFGLVGMTTIFLTLAGVFIDSGLSTALIQNKNPTSNDFSTVFIFNVLAGLTIYLILFVSAPLIADFFDQPVLTKIVRVVSLNFFINSFGIVQNSIFSKQMNFKVLTKISLIAILTSGTISIILAYLGFGVWSLICQGLIMTFITSSLLWFFSEWKPSFVFDKNSFKMLFHFGSKLMYANIISTIFQNVYLIIIGKVYTARQLGFYAKSEALAKTPVQNIYTIFQKVFFPAFSFIQDDNIQLKLVFKKILKVSSYIIFPIMLGLIALSKPFILFILTDKWSGSIIYLQLLCLSFMLYPFHALNMNILNVKGRSDLVLKLEYFKKGIIVLAIILTFKFGLIALIIGQVVSNLIAFFINTYYSGKLINYPVSEQIKDLLPYLALSVITALFLFIPVILLGEEYLLQLLIQLSFGTVFYLVVSRWFSLTGYYETREVLEQYTSSFISKFKK
jgi:O-antigen/teichoic acid export membrane protein